MASHKYTDFSNFSENWLTVYRLVLDAGINSYANRPLRGTGPQVLPIERACAATLCIQAAAQIEGLLQSHRYSQGQIKKDDRETILNFLEEPLRSHVMEVFVVRDVIMHGHIYQTTLQLDPYGLPQRAHNTQVSGRNDKNYKKHVFRNKTRLLKICVNPAAINMGDGVAVLSIVNEVYKFVRQRSKDMPLHSLSQSAGYQTEYFGSYMSKRLDKLPVAHARALRTRLMTIEKASSTSTN